MPSQRTRVPTARKKPSQTRALATVDVILEAAAHILETSGLEGFNTNVIAEKAGVSIGSLYQYFPNKDALVMALNDKFENEMKNLAFGIIEREPNLPLREGLQKIVLTLLEHHSHRFQLQQILEEKEAQLQTADQRFSPDKRMLAPLIKYLRDNSSYLKPMNFDQAAFDLLVIARAMTDSSLFSEKDPHYPMADKIVNALCGYLQIN